jgi:phage tail sheath gpL-like
MSSLTINIATNKQNDVLAAEIVNSGKDASSVVNSLQDFLKACAGGSYNYKMDLTSSATSPVAASGTFTLTSAIATDAITIGKTTLTASSTPANENEWEIDGASDTLDAASLAAAINAHSVLSTIVLASSATNVVTVTAHVRGILGNYINISSADATIVASATYLASGAGGASGVPVQKSNTTTIS